MSSAGLGRLLIVDDELGALDYVSKRSTSTTSSGHHGGGSPTVA
jgi:hypothetical protein